MKRLHLRTQLLIATLVLIGALTTASLLIIRYTVRSEVNAQVSEGIQASVRAFTIVERQRESQLSKSAAMLAELPTLKSMMTTEHAPTIQNGSEPLWTLSGSDLLVLATNDGRLMALHQKGPAWSKELALKQLETTIPNQTCTAWWYGDGRLYSIFMRPITAGSGPNLLRLGYIVVGYEVDSRVADELAHAAGSQVALVSRQKILTSTFDAGAERRLETALRDLPAADNDHQFEISLDGNHYEVASLQLQGSLPAPIRCYVLMPLARTTAFLFRLNWTIVYLGIAGIVLGGLVFLLIARAVTRPLDSLVAAVRALASGDYAYSLSTRGSTEIAELGRSFSTMRTRLQQLQAQRIEAERMAALGHTASSISHDLRHYLAAVVANAEFLYEMKTQALAADRDEVYQEIKTASDQMLDLIDSLREISREEGNILPIDSDLEQVVYRALDAVLAKSDFREHDIRVRCTGSTTGRFDPKKLERVFFNLTLNACEALNRTPGKVTIDIASDESAFEIRISDNGPGIPLGIRESLFDPFVSSGKPNGTGLGLAIVSRIVHDHHGEVLVETTSSHGTAFLIRLPRYFETPAIAVAANKEFSQR